MPGYPQRRLRRLRANATLREMLAGVRLSASELIAPLFVCEGENRRVAIPTLPGQYQLSVDTALETVRCWADAGLPAVLLFGLPAAKDAEGTSAWDARGPVQRLTGEIKKHLPQTLVITDVCLCQYTDHGHCGVLLRRPDGSTDVDNDATLQALARVALSHAEAGADLVAPSAMMDGQVAAIRSALDGSALGNVGILAYAIKFASSLYGPFRDAAGSAPASGDRRTYQMDPRNPRGIWAEAAADIEEGADILMVKPAGAYLDVIAELRRRTDLTIAAYHVSGEYAALKAGAAAGALEERAAALEITTAIKRAGADLIITYFAEQLAGWLKGV
ncbi:MAG: porphobilinogen synthase [Phycisphaerae bacterium]|nr:porphobilinogen synthase [Phycisphaerae bacterium]